jgi:hypothetical protein
MIACLGNAGSDGAYPKLEHGESIMLTTILRAAALMAFALLPLASPAVAGDDTKLVESIPPEVADVVSGGSWSADKKGGFYRAFVIMSGDQKSFGAHVYLQWLALSNDSPIPAVVKTVPVKEVNDQNLANASIEIDAEENKDNEITVIVSSYDFDADKDITLYVNAGQPGTYSMAKAPPKGPAGPPPKDAEAPAPKDAGAPAAKGPSNLPKDD